MDYCLYCEDAIYPDDEYVSVPDSIARAHVECSEAQEGSGDE